MQSLYISQSSLFIPTEEETKTNKLIYAKSKKSSININKNISPENSRNSSYMGSLKRFNDFQTSTTHLSGSIIKEVYICRRIPERQLDELDDI